MRLVPPLLLSLVTALVPLQALAAQHWEHQGEPAQLVELFTSEGCSSCPPADQYLSRLQGDPNLWSGIIPMAFHVDYWNYLGWRDRFSHPSFSQRQQLYRAYGAVRSVYTPGFVVDGEEWRGYFSRSALPKHHVDPAGTLRLTLRKQQADSQQQKQAIFNLHYDVPSEYMAHLVLLAMDEKTDVASGENRGRGLTHNFVVLEKQQHLAVSDWQFQLSQLPEGTDAVAVWLTDKGGFQPVQTVAGYISH